MKLHEYYVGLKRDTGFSQEEWGIPTPYFWLVLNYHEYHDYVHINLNFKFNSTPLVHCIEIVLLYKYTICWWQHIWMYLLQCFYNIYLFRHFIQLGRYALTKTPLAYALVCLSRSSYWVPFNVPVHVHMLLCLTNSHYELLYIYLLNY